MFWGRFGLPVPKAVQLDRISPVASDIALVRVLPELEHSGEVSSTARDRTFETHQARRGQVSGEIAGILAPRPGLRGTSARLG